MIPLYSQKHDKREKNEDRGHGQDQLRVERDFSLSFLKKPAKNIFRLMKDLKSQPPENDEHKKSEIYPGVSSVGEEAIAEKRKTGITKGRDGMKDRMSEGPGPGKFRKHCLILGRISNLNRKYNL